MDAADDGLGEDLVRQLPTSFNAVPEISRVGQVGAGKRSVLHNLMIVFGLVVLVGVVISWWLVQRIPGVEDAASAAQTRAGLATVLVGAAGLLAGLGAWQKLRSDEVNALIVRQDAERLQNAERLIGAAQMIASMEETVRLAGVSALKGLLATGNSGDRDVVRELLLSILRRGSSKKDRALAKLRLGSYERAFSRRTGEYNSDPSLLFPNVSLARDKQAALEVLAWSTLEFDYPLDLRGLDLRGAYISNFDLTQATFVRADLRSSIIRFCRLEDADFSDADMRSMLLDHCLCRGTSFYGAIFDHTAHVRFNDFTYASGFSEAARTHISMSSRNLFEGRAAGGPFTW